MAVIQVGMAELKVARGEDCLSTAGLGSCVGVCLWDPATKVGGMAHVMLPSSSLARSKTENKAKFADTAVEALVEEMSRQGAVRNRLVAKIAGGAQMFSFNNNSSPLTKIGDRNVEGVIDALKQAGIKLAYADTGGNYGRTIYFYPSDGRLVIRTIGHGEKVG